MVNLDALKQVGRVRTVMVDNSSLIAFVMRCCGMKYIEIGDVLGVSKQRAEVLVKEYKNKY